MRIHGLAYDTDNGVKIRGTVDRWDVGTIDVMGTGLNKILHDRFARLNRERKIARIKIVAIAEYEERI